MKETKQGRGMLTDSIRDKYTQMTNQELSVRELRLMPYLLSLVLDNKKLDNQRLNTEELEVLFKWNDLGWVEPYRFGEVPKISRHFYEIVTEVLWLGYVDIPRE